MRAVRSACWGYVEMKIEMLPHLHDSGTFPAPLGENEFVHLLYDHERECDRRVFVTRRDDSTWLLQQTYDARNEPLPNGFQLVLNAQGQIFILDADGSLREQSRYTFDRLQQLSFYLQRSLG